MLFRSDSKRIVAGLDGNYLRYLSRPPIIFSYFYARDFFSIFFYLRILLYVICSPEKCGSKNTFHNLCSTGEFWDSGAGAGLGNFLKRWVWVRRDSAIKKLLKIFLFIFSIYFYY